MKNKSTVRHTHNAHSVSHLPTALVAGAAGFIGSHLCDALLGQNCRVYGIDNWTTGKKENLKHLLDNKHFVFIEHDLNQPLKTGLPQVDYIFHLAGVEEYLNGLDVSLETLLVNSLGTKELLEMARKNQAKFLLASTINVFSGFLSATNLNHYFGKKHADEEAYSHHEAKRFSEALTAEYVNRHQLDARVVRLGNSYGPRMDLSSGTEIAKFFLAVKKKESLKIAGQGISPLYPTYVSDIVYGLTKAMFSQSSHSNIYTLINSEKTTSLNLAYQIKEAIENKDLAIEFLSGDDPASGITLTNEILKSQQTLGWSANVSLAEGIRKTLNWLMGASQNLKKTEGSSDVTEPEPEPEPNYTAESLGLLPDAAPTTTKPPKEPQPEMPKKRKFNFSWPKINFKSKPINITLNLLKPSKVSRKAKTWALIVTITLLGLFGPLLLTAGYAYAGFLALNQAKNTTDFAQTEKITKLTKTAENRLSTSRNFLSKGRIVTTIFGLRSAGDNLDRLLFIGIKLSQGANHLAQAGEAGTLLTQIVFQHQEGNISEALKRIQINLDQAYSELSFVESELQSGKQLPEDLSTPLTQKVIALSQELPTIRKKINQVRVLLPMMPGFIAQESKKTYLLLFQNSAEIRPTGGFIGSYGLLTFDKGRLLDFSIEDIYSADGQLQGFVEPPEPIKTFLGQASWFFRDSNWDPDFTVAAGQAEWFLQKETGRKVDGVIAVNLPAVKELLKATGPITLTDYNEEVTSDNLFERAEYRSEIDFFPGSTQKRDFLGSLGREIFTKAQEASSQELLLLSQAIETALAQKQILVYLHDVNSQQTLIEQNWAGALYEPNLSTSLDNLPVTSDYLFLVEANLGINKANYFLKRSLQHQVTILKNKELLSVATIDYQNQSPADAWPGGVYHSYVRAYLPEKAIPVSVKLGTDSLADDLLDQSVVANHLVLGFPISVPVKSSLKVEITYRVPEALELTNNKGRLAIVTPKQPGIIDDPIQVIVNYPSFLTVAAANPLALSSPQVITFDSNFQEDRVFTLDFIEQ
jgi:nucleoside-diphosphate-sugar epimerase